MNLIITLLVAFPAGLLIGNRALAHLAYATAFLFLYTSTAVVLLIDWAGGSDQAFGPFPKADTSQTWSFVGLSAAAFVVGFLLVHWGSVVRVRRTNSTTRLEATAA